MRYGRTDYDNLGMHLGDGSPGSTIPTGEPVFLLRAQDIAAPDTVEYWAGKARELRANNDIVTSALNQAFAMRDWQLQHPDKVRVPDLPPTVTPARQTAILDDWSVGQDDGRTVLFGIVTGHPKIPDGTLVTTSALIEICAKAGKAKTLNTDYELGSPA